jgi:pSer/pThr/pTyr-binding forkhead associated (FHA) protein
LRLDDAGNWWLVDQNSRNGTFIEEGANEARVSGAIPVTPGQLFRVGHTWLRIQPESA